MPDALPRVILVGHSAELGGAELSLMEEARAFEDQGKPTLTILPRTGPLTQLLTDKGLRTYQTRYPWLMRDKPMTSFEYHSRQVFSRLKAFQCSLGEQFKAVEQVITNTAVISFGYHLAKSLRASHTWLVHEIPSQFVEHKQMIDFMVQQDVTLTANSHFTIDAWLEQTKRSVQLEPEPRLPIVSRPALTTTPISIPEPDSRATLNLTTIGRICEAKAQADIIDLACLLASHYDRVVITLVGDADKDYLDHLFQKLDSLQRPRIELIHQKAHFAPFTQIARDSLVVQSSHNETYGRVLQEARLAGFPQLCKKRMANYWKKEADNLGTFNKAEAQLHELLEDSGWTLFPSALNIS